MAGALTSGSSGPGLSPGCSHCFVFLGKTLYFDRASLHPDVEIGIGECNNEG